jgi:hypothetical protein
VLCFVQIVGYYDFGYLLFEIVVGVVGVVYFMSFDLLNNYLNGLVLYLTLLVVYNSDKEKIPLTMEQYIIY